MADYGKKKADGESEMLVSHRRRITSSSVAGDTAAEE